MAVKAGLRERFKTTDFLNAEHSSIERMGALYYNAHRIDDVSIQTQFREFLQRPPVSDAQETLLRLHAAIILAQHGEYDGVAYILNMLSSSEYSSHVELAETALRNCNQFPLAVLLGQALEFQSLNQQHERLKNLLQLSDDDLFTNANDGADQNNTFTRFCNQIIELNDIHRQEGRELAIGTILRTPVRRDNAYRYSGFLAVERGISQNPLVVPFTMGDVLNRDDQSARVDIWQLSRRPGRKAIVVYHTNAPYEAQQLYILPFAEQSNDSLAELATRLALGSDGLHVGVAVEIIQDRGGYRVITSDGLYRWERFQVDRKKIGSCTFIHDLNSISLGSEMSASPEIIEQVALSFQKTSTQPKAVLVGSQGEFSLIGSLGKIPTQRGKLSNNTIYYIEEVVTRNNEKKKIPFEIPGLSWSATARAQTVLEYFQSCPNTYAVVLGTFEFKDKLSARVVHFQSSEVHNVIISKKVDPGTLAITEIDKLENKPRTQLLYGYSVSGGCPYCFGSDLRICGTCQGTGKIVCPNCKDGKVSCEKCEGTGDCQHCTDGFWRNGNPCPICKTTGKCQNCKPAGSGLWNCRECHGQTIINCTHCSGARIVQCSCTPTNKTQIITTF